MMQHQNLQQSTRIKLQNFLDLAVKKPYITSVATSLILFIAYFFSFPYIVFIGLIPWLYMIRQVSAKTAWKTGFILGLTFYLLYLSWLVPLTNNQIQNIWLSFLPWLIGSLIGSTYFIILSWLTWVCYSLKKPILIPFVWAGIEIFRSYVPTFAFPWGMIAISFWKTPALVQHASLGTIYLVSAWIVMINVVIVELIKGSPFKKQFWQISSIGALLGFSLFRYYISTPETKNYTIIAGQIGVDLARPKNSTVHQQLFINSAKLFSELDKADLLLLSEGLTTGSETLPPKIPFPYVPKVATIFGGQRTEDSKVYQSAFLVEDGKWSSIDKTRLVIFGEFIPFKKYIPLSKEFNLTFDDLTPAEKPQPFYTRNFQVGPIMCFEALFPDIAHQQTQMGANLLAVISMDDWYVDTIAMDHLRASTVWRAIESGLPLARSSSLGSSFLVDNRGNRIQVRDSETGKMLKEAPLKELYAYKAEVPIPKSSDAFKYRWGFVWLASIITVGVALTAFIRGLYTLFRKSKK